MCARKPTHENKDSWTQTINIEQTKKTKRVSIEERTLTFKNEKILLWAVQAIETKSGTAFLCAPEQTLRHAGKISRHCKPTTTPSAEKEKDGEWNCQHKTKTPNTQIKIMIWKASILNPATRHVLFSATTLFILWITFSILSLWSDTILELSSSFLFFLFFLGCLNRH